MTETLDSDIRRLVLSGHVRAEGGFYAWPVSTSAIPPASEPACRAVLIVGLAANEPPPASVRPR